MIRVNQILKSRKSSRVPTRFSYGLFSSKRSFDMPFSWLFAMIAGAFILFIAIYAATKFTSTGGQIASSESAKMIANLLNPAVSGIASSYTLAPLKFNKETRIHFSCEEKTSNSPIFGRQIIAFSEQSGFLSKWSAPGLNISRYNKYVFADNVEQGKTFYILVRPFYTGFKVDDLIMMSSKDYCFIAPPENIREEIDMMGAKNINSSNTIKECKKGSVSVCFNSENSFSAGECNVTISGECSESWCSNVYEMGTVVKNGITLNYAGNLMYAAIFSSPKIYNCNMVRLGNKIDQLSTLYSEKITIMKMRDCTSNTESDLLQINEASKIIKTSAEIVNIYSFGKVMDETACNEKICSVYEPETCI